jgi:hypothetical protein
MKHPILLLALLLVGCVGSPVHETAHYNSVQSLVKKNNAAILMLHAGMDKTEVTKAMKAPERSEGYPWGSVWLYRTAMTSGTYGSTDDDFTPLVFSRTGQLEGWGRNYYDHVSRSEQIIKVEKPQ